MESTSSDPKAEGWQWFSGFDCDGPSYESAGGHEEEDDNVLEGTKGRKEEGETRPFSKSKRKRRRKTRKQLPRVAFCRLSNRAPKNTSVLSNLDSPVGVRVSIEVVSPSSPLWGRFNYII